MKNFTRTPRAALMTFSALASAAFILAPGAALAAPGPGFVVADGDEIEITEDVSADPAVRFVGAGDVVVRSGVDLVGTGNYTEFQNLWTDATGAVVFNAGGGSLTIEAGATAIGGNYGITTPEEAGYWTMDGDSDWYLSDFVSDPRASANMTVINHGDIAGLNNDAIRLFNHATIINTGSIIGASDLPAHESANIGGSLGDGISSANVGLQDINNFPTDGIMLRVNNSGEIIGRRMGIIASAGGHVINSGEIHGQSSGVLLQTSTQYGGPGNNYRPYLRGWLENSGSITADFQNGVNVQSWSLHWGTPFDLTEIDVEDYDFFDTFDPFSADAMLINSGLIETFAESGGATMGVVIDPETGEQVPVEGASLFYAVRIGSVQGYFLNEADGVIRALNGANAVRLQSSNTETEHGFIVMDNQGTIIGSVIGANTTEEDGVITDWAGQELIRNNGLIDGDVALGGGNDVFWLDANGSVTGAIDLGLGDDLMIWNTKGSVGDFVTGGEGQNILALILGGTEFNASKVFNFQTVLTYGSGDLGDIDLTYVPEIQLGQGASLDIGATNFTGWAYVNDGALLRGSGTVDGIVVTGDGTVAPGNSIGVINVVGDATFSSTFIYDVEVSPVGSDQVLAGGDLILTGGTVLVTGEDGNDLAPGTALASYTIMSGATGRTGEFDFVRDDLQFYQAVLNYTATAVELELVPVGADFLGAAGNSNERSVGEVLQDGLLRADGDFLTAMMDSFPTLDSAGIRQGLNTLSGPAHAWAPLQVSELGMQVSRLVSRGPSVGAGEHAVWASALQGSLDIDASADTVGADMDVQGGVFGLNGGINANTSVGMFLGFANTDGNDTVGGRVESDGWFIGGRIASQMGAVRISAEGGYLSQEVDTTRAIVVGGLSRTATADYKIDGFFGSAEVSWDHQLNDAYSAGLFGSISGGSYSGGAFSEIGAGSLSLQGDGTDFSRAAFRLGARIQGDSGWVRPRLEAGIQAETGARSETLGMNFVGVAGDFDVRGPGVENNAPFIAVGADFRISDAISASVAYDGVFGDESESQGFLAKLSMRF
jgi:uncharacterized protein with beta-barrel porin domain